MATGRTFRQGSGNLGSGPDFPINRLCDWGTHVSLEPGSLGACGPRAGDRF